MREVISLKREAFKDDYGIDLSISLAKGDVIETQAVNDGLAADMLEGESRIDVVNNRKVIKINGELYKEYVDSNNEVKFQKI